MAAAAIARTGDTVQPYFQPPDTVGTAATFVGSLLDVAALVTVLDISALVPTDGVTYAEIGDVAMPGVAPGARLVVIWAAPNSRLRLLHEAPRVVTPTGTVVSYEESGSIDFVWSGSRWVVL